MGARDTSQTVSGRQSAELQRAAFEDLALEPVALARGHEARQQPWRAWPVETFASCTDASGNYVGEEVECGLEVYIDVESLAGRLLCPGCRRPATRHEFADPVHLAGLRYFGTSDENLYLKQDTETPAYEVRGMAEAE